MNRLLPILLIFLFSACATYKSNQVPLETSKLENIDSETVNVFMIGDAGKLNEDGSASSALQSMQSQFSKADKKDFLLFLGDNIYPRGLPSKDDTEYKMAEETLNVQLQIAEDFPGKVLFIPGNHDWYSGVKGLKNQEKMVEKALGKNTFQPENGCPIEKVKINDDAVLLIVDSHWYITNWSKHPTINDNCEFKTRDDFLDEFRSEIKKARGKTTLVAIHHPMFTNGLHGGNYSFLNHVLPLPILGTFKNVLRTTSGIVNADLYNQFYNDLRKNLIAAAQQNERVIFLSGHDHSLQYIESDNIKQIISGSGSKTTAVKVKGKDNYGEGALGFAVLNISKDQSVDVQFYTVETEPSISFKKTVFPALSESQFSFEKTQEDWKTASIYTKEETSKSKFYEFLWGTRFRDYYSMPVKVKVVYLDTLKGGLKPLRKGGGTQSKTLHLETNDGKRYVLRAMKKQATQFIQSAILVDQYVEGQFDDTTSEKFLEDVFTGSYPYAPFVIGSLSDAVNLAHLNPELYYVPKQAAFGSYNSEFGNELYLFEEHPSEGHLELTTQSGFTGNIISTFDMIKEIQSDESIIIDQEEFIKARLFDMLIGDADRHQDQWRWMEFKEKGITIYRPLPRDRDLAFSRMSDGFLFGLAVSLIPPARKFRKYESDLTDVKGFNVSGFPLDVAFIVDADKSVWNEQVKYIQSNITDEVIEQAFQNIPLEVQDSTIDGIKALLKARRENLQEISNRYLRLINKHAVLTATNKDDFIKVEAYQDGSVTVSMYRKKDNTIKDMFHNRTYYPDETKEIWIYGLDDDDTFEVVGKSNKIKLRLIGGQNNDEYKVDKVKNVVIYDYKSKKNDFSQAKNTRKRLTDDYNTNVYDYRKLKNNQNQLLPMLGYNPDDGFKIGFMDTYTAYGFERNPFTSQHKLGVAYYFATNGYELGYQGEFANVVGNLNLLLDVHFQSPNFSFNFFGYGNETENFDDELGLDYNRVKVRNFSISPALLWNSKRGSKITAGVQYETIEVHKTDNRFVSDNSGILPDYLFDEVQFAGANASFEFLNYDNRAFPTMGLRFNLEVGFKSNLDQNGRTYGYLIPKLGIAHKLIPSGNLVIATTLKSHLNFGNDYEFYQAASIGGTDGLRGFRNQRFTGKRSFYQNTDLRYSFSNLKTDLAPIKVGAYGSFDYGRIWMPSLEDSDKWHNSYGCGLFVNVVDLLSANFGAFNSSDGVRVAFGLGFEF